MFKDRYETIIRLGDFVAYYYYGSVLVGKVKKFTPKMVTIQKTKKSRFHVRRFPYDIVVVTPPKLALDYYENS